MTRTVPGSPAKRSILSPERPRRLALHVAAAVLLWLRAVPAAEPVPQPAHHCLWRVESDSGALFLLGSVHLLKPAHYPLSPVIESAFATSAVLVLEVDLGTLRDPATQLRLMQKGTLPAGQTLQGILKPETFKLASQRASDMKLNAALFAAFKPWMFGATLSLLKIQALGFKPEHGIEQHFYDAALKAGKPVLGLETIDYQVDLLDSLAGLDPDALLTQMLNDLAVVETQLNEIVQAWSCGDLPALEATLLRSLKDYPDIFDRFIVQRNRNWMARIDAFLKTGNVHMVIVGAGHLAGKDGLVSQLRERGFKVVQW
jgi:uncharacterized protein